MKGFPLSYYPEGLAEIAPNANSAWTVRDLKKKLEPYRKYVEAWRDWPSSRQDFIDLCGELPRQCLLGLSFEDLTKIYWSRFIKMEHSVCKMFEQRAEYELVRKLNNSMWHWGCGCGGRSGKGWNTMVRAYHAIRQFDFGLSGFTARLDYTTHCNPVGYTKCSRSYLDGVFGFLVYHGDVHVLTIGFSVASDDRLLVTQVQLAKQKGNRFLYKLPHDYVDHVLIQLSLAFRNFEIFLIDGESLGDNLLEQYRNGLRESRHELRKLRKYPESDTKEQLRRITRAIERYRECKKNTILCRVAGIRMERIYSGLRVHKKVLDRPLVMRKLLFHPVIPVSFAT
jgi:hypothetical protein